MAKSRFVTGEGMPGRRGKAALDAFYGGAVRSGRPLLFLDFDGVLCVGRPYDGFDVIQPEGERPADLWEKLWHPPAVSVLQEIVEEFEPNVVLTTSWLRRLKRQDFVDIFNQTGLHRVAGALHSAWAAPQRLGSSRHDAIVAWLYRNYSGQALAILDDDVSGSGLRGSRLDKAGCVILCDASEGFSAKYYSRVNAALGNISALGGLSEG